MRSGRGKCPQCKEMIVVDLDAKELRCPLCNALLKKSAKTVAQVRAEQAAKEAEEAALAAKEAAVLAAKEAEAAAQAAKEQAAAQAAKETEVAEQVADAQEPEVAVETPAEPVEEPVQETQEVPAEESAEVAATQEAPAEDEIGLSDEELAMMDENVPETAVENDAAQDEIGISDEELAMMDEPSLTDDAPASEAPADEGEPVVYGSIDAVTEEEAVPEEAETVEEVAEEEALVNNNVELADDEAAVTDETIPVVIDDAPAEEEPAEVAADVAEEVTEDAEEQEVDESSVVEQEDEPIQSPDDEKTVVPQEEEPAVEVESQEDALADEPATEEVAVEDAPEVEEETSEELSQEGEEVAADQVEDEDAGYTEEDMEFAASLSETGRTGKGTYVAPTARPDSTAKKAERDYEKAASKGEKTMNVYKKPIAILMMLLSIVAGAIWVLYYKVLTFGLISVDLMTSVMNALPTFGGDKFYSYVITAFWGLVAVVSLLGLTGKKGKAGFLFVLLASVVMLLTEGSMISIKAINKIVVEHPDYVTYAFCGLLLLAAVFFAVAMASGKDEYEFSGGGAVFPIIYLVVVVVGYVALILLPKFMSSFTVSANLLNYSILGAIGVSLVMTFFGVHSGTASRSVNGWAIFATLLTIVLVNLTPIVVGKITEASKVVLDTQETVPYFLTPIIAIFPVIGFTASDLRN